MAYETITDLKNNIEWYENRIAQLNRDSQKICAVSTEHFQHEMASAKTGLAGYKRLLAEELAKRTLKNQAKQPDTASDTDLIQKHIDNIHDAELKAFQQGQKAQLEDVYKVLRGLGYPGASEELKKFMERI